MKSLSRLVLHSSLFALLPIIANAAGTYYTGYYQNPQQSYSTQNYAQRQTTGYNSYSSYNRSYTSPNYSPSSYSSSRYSNTQQQATKTASTAPAATVGNTKSGFWANAGVSREMAMWQFDMKESGSILHYDNISWNVLDLNAGYAFDLGKSKMQIDAGFKYGMQAGESYMVDDDVTNGGYFITQWINADDNSVIGNQLGHALSVGTSQGGSMMGFNAGIGLVDFFKIGNLKFTPSVGYRYLSYNLTTEKNYGLSVDTGQCVDVGSGEIQCNPIIIIHYDNGTQEVLWYAKDENNDGFWDIADGANGINPGGTYFYQQPGTSHDYDVSWAGPYVAVDMDYDINENNAVNGRVELGLPGYKATGDQPYRFDWQHPKSVEDEAGMGSALHLGLAANWTTAITNSVALSIGLTYDYYSVNGADAKTYLNGDYYMDWYNAILNSGLYENEEAMLNPETGSAEAINIKNLETQCPGWVCSANGEIEAFYKSMGIRVGVNAKF